MSVKKIVGLFIVVLFSFSVVGVGFFKPVQASTSVSGIISSNTTWTKTSSPYAVTGNILVKDGVTLTIEPGVTINIPDDFYILINGTLTARGTSEQPIQISGGSYNFPTFALTFGAASTSWNQAVGEGSIIENAVLNSSILCQGVSPKLSKNTISGEIGYLGGSPLISENIIYGLVSDISQEASPVIVNNKITGYINDLGGGSANISNNILYGAEGHDWVGRPFYQSCAIVTGGYTGNACIYGNIIYGFFETAAIEVDNGSPSISRNLINNTLSYTKPAIQINAGSPIIQNNTIFNSDRGIVSDSSTVQINYNNIYGNTENLRLSNHATGAVNATYNWWGTSNESAIAESIYDFNEDFNLGTVNFTPFLNQPNPQAMPDFNAELPSAKPTPSVTPTATATPSSTSASETPLPSNPSPTTTLATESPLTQPPFMTDLAAVLVVFIIVIVAVGAFLLGKKVGRNSQAVQKTPNLP